MIWCGSPIVEIYFTCLSFVLSKLIQHWIAGLRVRSSMTWLGAPPIFLAENFFAVHVRSFCSKKKLLWKCLWHTNYSTSFITSDVFAKHSFLLLARPYGVSDCTQRHFRMLLTPNYEMQPSVVLFWLYDVRIPWNFNISKSYFSFNMSKMDQFQRNLFNVRNNANAFFRLSIRVK